MAAGIRRVKVAKRLGVRVGNGLSTEQRRLLLGVSAGVDLRAQRNWAILAVLIGCGLGRAERTDAPRRRSRYNKKPFGVVKWASRSVFGTSHGRVRRRLPGSCALSSCCL